MFTRPDDFAPSFPSFPVPFPLPAPVEFFPFGKISSFPLSESFNIHRIISVFSSFSTLDPAWVQRTLLLQRREQLLLSTFDTYQNVNVGGDSVARVLQEEALPTLPS